MNRFIKLMVFTATFIAISVIAGSILLSRFVDPNQYKDRIIALINKETGYYVVMNGQIGWTLFPRLGFSIQHVELKARMDAPSAFITLADATVSVKVLPLLDKQVHIDALHLDGLTINLENDMDGNGNWQTSLDHKKRNTAGAPTTEVVNTLDSAQPTKTSSDLTINIASIEVNNSSITYVDAKTAQAVHLDNFNIKMSGLFSNTNSHAEVSFDFNVKNPEIKSHLTLNADITANMKNQTYQLTNLIMEGDFTGHAFKEKSVPFKIVGNVLADLKNQIFKIKDGVFAFANLTININIDKNIRTKEYKGTIGIPAFDVATFHQFLPNSKSDDKKNQRDIPVTLAMDAELAGNNQYLFLNNIQILLNDLSLSARVGITSFDTNALDITVNGNQIQIETLLAALGKDPRFSGLINFSTHLMTHGSGDDAIKNLNGNGQFEVFNGALKGENLTQKLCEAIALINKTASTQARSADTHFDVLKGSFAIQNGIVRSNDLTATMKGSAIQIQGLSDILQQTINADVGVTVTGDSEDVACSVNERYQNVVLPLKCKGTYQTEPGKLCNVDKEGLANIAKGALIEKVKEKYGDKFNNVLDKLFGN